MGNPMHETAAEKMRELLNRYCPPDPNRKVLEIGSRLIGGDPTWPDEFPVGGFRSDIIHTNEPEQIVGVYTGLDIVPGVNVDIVTTDPYHWPIEDNAFDLVISGQCMEHVENLVL